MNSWLGPHFEFEAARYVDGNVTTMVMVLLLTLRPLRCMSNRGVLSVEICTESTLVLQHLCYLCYVMFKRPDS